MEVFIPSFRYEESELERGYTVFKIEVLTNGRKHFVEKRYSEFHALHKKLKKFIRTPEIPSKHVRNWVPKVLEQRRHGLEVYLQSIISDNEELPKIFLDFLSVRHFPSLPKAESCGSFEETESEESSKLSHQPVLLFLRDPYVLPTANGICSSSSAILCSTSDRSGPQNHAGGPRDFWRELFVSVAGVRTMTFQM